MSTTTTEARVLRPVPAAPNFQLTLYAEPVQEPYRYNRDSIDTAAQEKVLAQLARGGAPRRKRPASPAFRALDFYAAKRQQAEYERVMGRTWHEIDPEPAASDFGGPAYPDDYPQEKDFRPYGRVGKVRAQLEYRAAMDAWNAEYDAYRAAMATWESTPEHAQYVAARTYWATRRAQFSWTGRGRNDTPLESLVELTIDGEPA